MTIFIFFSLFYKALYSYFKNQSLFRILRRSRHFRQDFLHKARGQSLFFDEGDKAWLAFVNTSNRKIIISYRFVFRKRRNLFWKYRTRKIDDFLLSQSLGKPSSKYKEKNNDRTIINCWNNVFVIRKFQTLTQWKWKMGAEVTKRWQ